MTETQVTPRQINKPFSGALVYRSANKTLNTGVTYQVDFDSETYDTDSWHDTSTNNSRLTVPAGVSYVVVKANVHISGGGGAHICQIKKNGAVIVGSPYGYTWDEMGICLVTPTVAVSESDYFELEVYQSQAATNTLYKDETWFSIEKVYE